MERTGLRDLHFNLHHHTYGPKLTAYDSDMNWYDDDDNYICKLELKHGALGEYGNGTIDLQDQQFRCGRKEADKAGIPYFCVVYYFYHQTNCKYPKLLDTNQAFPITHIQYFVVPCNSYAQAFVPTPLEMTEEQFVALEYRIRGLSMPTNLKLFTKLWDQCCPPTIRNQLT